MSILLYLGTGYGTGGSDIIYAGGNILNFTQETIFLRRRQYNYALGTILTQEEIVYLGRRQYCIYAGIIAIIYIYAEGNNNYVYAGGRIFTYNFIAHNINMRKYISSCVSIVPKA